MAAKWGTRAWLEGHFSTPLDEGDAWGHRWRASQRLRHRRTLDAVRPILEAGGLNVLDIGCGLGEFTAALTAIHPDNRVMGVELSERAVQRAREAKPHIDFRVGTLPTLELPDAAFDVVTALEVLYYMDDADQVAAVDELQRVLSPGGHLVFSSTLDDGQRYFSEKTAVGLLEPAFEVEEVRTIHGRLYAALERPLLRLRIGLGRVVHRADRRMGSLVRLVRHLITIALGVEAPARLLEWLCSAFPGRPGRSHILIVARKNTPRDFG